ncbi:MAG TPA: methyltransferase domain-containing protein [Candidatus Dormibacteraeota bacterium]|nr:methyltransferase domain-containing protein [Candidatus Dormibacteraeota bacterium]
MATTIARPAIDVKSLDPYAFLAVLGKRVIHSGGRRSTEELFALANLDSSQLVLDVGCGVGTTTIGMARRFGTEVTAVDISPLMLEGARANVRRAPDNSFDRVIAEAVTMFVDRPRAAAEVTRVCPSGGMVLAAEFLWRQPPSDEARELFLGQLCPGLQFDNLDGWLQIYSRAGLTDLQVRTGPFELMTARGFINDEGLVNAIACMVLGLWKPECVRKMAWMMPRLRKAVPYLGYVLVAGRKPAVS